MSFGYKICPLCCPEGETYTNRHERTTSPAGAPVWRCLCCSNELPRQERRSTAQVQDDEARDALGIDPADDSLEAMLATIDYGQRKAAGVPLTGDLTLQERLRLLDADSASAPCPGTYAANGQAGAECTACGDQSDAGQHGLTCGRID